MKLGELLNKCIDEYNAQYFLLTDEVSLIDAKLAEGEKNMRLLETKNSRYERKAVWFGVIGSVAGILCGLTAYLNVVSPLIALISFAILSGSFYVIYINDITKIRNEIENFKIKISDERKKFLKEMGLKNRRIIEINNIIRHLNSIINFFGTYHYSEKLKKDASISENELIFCLENDISLLSVLYLADNGLLQKKGIDLLTKRELEKFKIKTNDLDRLLMNNPFFFSGEEKKMQNVSTSKNDKHVGKSYYYKPIPDEEDLFDEYFDGKIK